AVRACGGHLYRETRKGGEVCARGPVGETARQLGAAVARGPHAPRRPQGVGRRPGGGRPRGGRDGRAEEGGVPNGTVERRTARAPRWTPTISVGCPPPGWRRRSGRGSSPPWR